MKLLEFVEKYNNTANNTLKEQLLSKIKITPYVSIIKKDAYAQLIVDKTTFEQEAYDDNGKTKYRKTDKIRVNSVAQYIQFCRAVIELYTDLEIDEDDKGFIKGYDALKSSGLLDILMVGSDKADPLIPISELSEFKTILTMKQSDTQFNETTTQAFISKQIRRISDLENATLTPLMDGGVDTRGTKYADTRYGTVIYDLKEESVLQANITDELQKQGQMLEKITYEKGQVFDKSEDTRIQGILDQQAKAKEIETEFNKIFDSTNLNTYNSELDSVNQKLTENESIINNCKSAIETADEDAKRFAKEMAEFDLHMSDEEIAETVNKNKVEYQERIEELSKEQSLLKDRKQEIESNLDAEYKLANAVRERATATVEDRMKDAFPDKDVSAYVESATNSIKKENNALEQNTQKVKENTQAKEQNANINLNKYDKRLDSYNGKVDKYQATIDRFNDGGWTSKTYLENVQAVRDAVKQYATLLDNIKTNQNGIASDEDIQNLDKYEKKIKDTIATVTNMSAAEKGYNFVSGQKELDKIHKLLAENSKMSSEAKNKIRAYYREIESGNPNMSLDKIHGEIMKIYNAEVEAGRAGRSFFDTLKNSGFHQLAAQMAGMFGFYDVINLGKEAISTIVSLDDALVDLKKTTAMNSTQLEDFYYDANDVAKQMGVTTEEIITQASAWSRLGYSSQEAATTMAKLSSKFASISPGMSTDEAQEGLVSIMKAFDIDPDDVETEIMDKVNVLGNKFAEENQDVIEGLKRSAAAMSAMGQSFTDTAALFTGGMEILQDSESMGTALRTLSMRVRGYDEETNQLSDDLVNVTGEVADLTKTAQDSQGVSLFTDATQEHYRSMVEYLGDIADRWDQISEKNQTELLQKLFGKNRANAGAAIIQNFDQVRAAIEAMDESAGSSEAEMSAIESSLSYKINALKETWVGCVQDMIDRGDLGTIVTGLTKVSEAITFLLDKLGILGTIGLGAGIFSGIKNVGRDKMYSLSF